LFGNLLVLPPSVPHPMSVKRAKQLLCMQGELAIAEVI